ncbi:MAG: chromosomal replication initiator protein DnaA [Corynebacterium sp.]|nr:chromosomal replication initiator protein DnaA [Corynebacterium sp.]
MSDDTETLPLLWRSIVSAASRASQDPNSGLTPVKPLEIAFMNLAQVEFTDSMGLNIICPTEGVYALINGTHRESVRLGIIETFGSEIDFTVSLDVERQAEDPEDEPPAPEDLTYRLHDLDDEPVVPKRPAVPVDLQDPADEILASARIQATTDDDAEDNFEDEPEETPASTTPAADPQADRKSERLHQVIIREQIEKKAKAAQAGAAAEPVSNPPAQVPPAQEPPRANPAPQIIEPEPVPERLEDLTPDDYVPEERPKQTKDLPNAYGLAERIDSYNRHSPAYREAMRSSERPEIDPVSRVSSRFTFENFIAGTSNTLLYSACLTAAEDPGRLSPLFIWGESGLGKTHLLHAIGNYTQFMHPNSKVLYVTMEEFTNDFINAIHDVESKNRHRNRYRELDVLLIDDIQFLERKEGTQEEFFHTINALSKGNKQIVMTCDRPPHSLVTLAQRLTTRFGSGLTTDVVSPDIETRIAILRAECKNFQGLEIDNEALELIASHYTNSVRELLGGLTLVVSSASVEHMAVITAAFARQALQRISPGTAEAPVTVDMIVQATAKYFDVEPSSLISTTKTRKVTHARQLAMYLARELTDLSTPRIGEYFGGKDHTTVLYADRKIRNALVGPKANQELAAEVQTIATNVRNQQRIGVSPDASAKKKRPVAPRPKPKATPKVANTADFPTQAPGLEDLPTREDPSEPKF